MALIVRLSKGPRDYVLKAHRPEWWASKISKLEAEIAALEYGSEDADKKNKELKQLKESAAEASQMLAQFNGPTVFKLHSVSKLTARLAAPKELKKRNIKVNEEDGVSVETLDYSRDYSAHICKMGLDGWSNLINYDDGAQIPFDKSIIDALPDDVVSELAGEISGAIDAEDIRNLKKPSSL